MANDEDRSRQVYEQYEEALFRLAINQLAEERGKELQSTKEPLQSLPESRPSEAALHRFSKQLDAYMLQQQAPARKRKVYRVLHRVAVAVLAIFVVLGTAMTTVEAFRSKVMNLWLDIQPQYTIFRLKEADPGSIGSDLVIDWTNAYVPTYIPEEYRIGSISIKEATRELVFEHSAGLIIYMEMQGSSGPVIDTENADRVETVTINDHSGTLVEKNGMTTIVWGMEGRLFLIQALTESKVALRVARGVRFVK